MAEDNTVGPSFKLNKADYSKIHIHWVEWASKDALGSDGVLSSTDGALYYIGAYPDGDNGEIYLNPLKT